MPNIQNFEQQLGKLKPGEKDKFLDNLIGELQHDQSLGQNWKNVQKKSVEDQLNAVKALKKEQDMKKKLRKQVKAELQKEAEEKAQKEAEEKAKKEAEEEQKKKEEEQLSLIHI